MFASESIMKQLGPISHIQHKENNVCFPANKRRWPIPANTRRWPKVGLTLAHGLQRWPNVSPTLGQRFVFAGLDWAY